MDIPIEGFDQSLLLVPGVKYVSGDSEELLLKAPEDRNITLKIVASMKKEGPLPDADVSAWEARDGLPYVYFPGNPLCPLARGILNDENIIISMY